MRTMHYTIGQKRALFFSLKNQFESGRPMTESEEKTMWELQGDLWVHYGGFRVGMKIKTNK